MDRELRVAAVLADGQGREQAAREAGAAGGTCDRLLGLPHAAAGDASRAARVREARDRRRQRELEAPLVPRADRERPSPARRHLSRLPDLLTWPAPATTSHAPTCSGEGSPRPVPGSRRSSQACRCRRAPASTGEASSPEVPGWRSLSTAATRSCRGCSRTGSPQSAAGPAQRVLVSVFLEGGADSLSMLYPAEDPLYRRLRPRLALPASAGAPFAEDSRLRWHPSLAPLADAPRRGQGDGTPRRRLHGPGPVALHVTPLLGGRRHRRPPAHRLARPLSRPRRARRATRCRGSRSSPAFSRRSRPPRSRSPRSTPPTATTSGREVYGATSRSG